MPINKSTLPHVSKGNTMWIFTFPIGLCGVLITIALVFSVNADSSSSLSQVQSFVEVAFSFWWRKSQQDTMGKLSGKNNLNWQRHQTVQDGILFFFRVRLKNSCAYWSFVGPLLVICWLTACRLSVGRLWPKVYQQIFWGAVLQFYSFCIVVTVAVYSHDHNMI